ncbi:LexA family transcriptional regulator [Chryseobacterium sp. 2987]|uniref:XRE family transcriptional regulator n=1 Tax=Chryseobacterium sp. 2987 TaxID=2817767 RepID=UPI00285E9701|nr:LexA family transcriptional regulator [Chryseobacterium sp. 2987]MDR6919532.1 transcriptional regulator with XRE-family HTH domain [Chryseobacterium sp. 2987]
MSTLSILADNIRYLRMQQIPELSQAKIAGHLRITRESYAKYETAKNTPPLDVLLAISRYYHVSTDLLLTVDLRKYRLEEMVNLPDNRILLPVKTDSAGENKIEIVPYKASMGYLNGYADPQFIESLQTLSLPFLRNGKHRAFQTEGDSMPPLQSGSYVVGKYVETLAELKKDKTYIFITDDGITYKRLKDQFATEIEVSADNQFYKPYKIHKQSLLEIWEYKCSIATEEIGLIEAESNKEKILRMFDDLKKEIINLKE